jgi:hypothetical protein
MGEKSGIRIRDEQLGPYFRELKKHLFWAKTLKFFDAYPGYGMEKIRVDKHPESETLLLSNNIFNRTCCLACSALLWRAAAT